VAFTHAILASSSQKMWPHCSACVKNSPVPPGFTGVAY